jgi:putative alpha-1,2-mannosidase
MVAPRGRVRLRRPVKPLLVKVAVSSVSEDNAIANLDKDGEGFDFDAIAPKPGSVGEGPVARSISMAPPTLRKKFYTSLYHALISPSLSMDVNGEYRGPDNQVHTRRASISIPPGRCGMSIAPSSR